MTPKSDRTLSAFIDAWNAGQRPDVNDYLSSVPEAERGELADQLISFMSFAPTPEYSDAALDAIRAEPVVLAAHAAGQERAGLLPSLLTGLRERFSMSTSQVAGELVEILDLPSDRAPKTAGYLERLESGNLEPARVSRRVFAALARLFQVPRDQLEGAADIGGWRVPPVAMTSAPVFRAEDDAADAIAPHLELLADALATPSDEGRDDVDELFLGGR